MNVIDWKQATAAVDGMEQSSTKIFLQEILPVVQASVDAVVNHALDRIDASAGNAITALGAIKDETLRQLDGWTVSITIPSIVIELHKPTKENAQ